MLKKEEPHVVIIGAGFGGLCVMVEGRCALSAYATGESPNCNGACSPGKHVRWEDTPRGMETRLNGILIDRFAEKGRSHRFQYLPFGAGPRTCVGAQFATVEALTLLALWLGEWRFVDAGHPALLRMWGKRQRGYRAMGYRIQMAPGEVAGTALTAASGSHSASTSTSSSSV